MTSLVLPAPSVEHLEADELHARRDAFEFARR